MTELQQIQIELEADMNWYFVYLARVHGHYKRLDEVGL
tara:strand:+ start:292 stop:405 length:114 start_codon:yes stop_codon:yes gene_type:complete